MTESKDNSSLVNMSLSKLDEKDKMSLSKIQNEIIHLKKTTCFLIAKSLRFFSKINSLYFKKL